MAPNIIFERFDVLSMLLDQSGGDLVNCLMRFIINRRLLLFVYTFTISKLERIRVVEKDPLTRKR